MPEAGHHHVLDAARLSVGEAYFDFLSRWLRRWPGSHRTGRSGWTRPNRRLRLRFKWFAIPFRIAEMKVRLHEIVDRKVILAVIKARAAPDDLFELDHRIDRSHQHDVADVSRIDTG